MCSTNHKKRTGSFKRLSRVGVHDTSQPKTGPFSLAIYNRPQMKVPRMSAITGVDCRFYIDVIFVCIISQGEQFFGGRLFLRGNFFPRIEEKRIKIGNQNEISPKFRATQYSYTVAYVPCDRLPKERKKERN